MIYASSYGAVGDGVTDDGPAVVTAVEALKECGPGSLLVFGKNKTYNISSVSNTYALFEIKNCMGLEIDGNGSKFILGAKKSYGWFENTKNCIFTDMTFDYATSPAFKAAFVSGSYTNKTVVLKADRDIGLTDGQIYKTSEDTGNYSANNTSWWGVIDKHDTRYHIDISQYEMISTSENTFRLYFKDGDQYNDFVGLLQNGLITQYGMICPMPGWGHRDGSNERGFTVIKNVDFTMSHIDINAVCRFGMLIGQNEGSVIMDDVDFVPADSSLKFTSWRDAFHVKDNRCSVTWSNCEASGNYDDVFNISSSTLYVSDYDADTRQLSLIWPENSGGLYYTILPGDTIRVIDTATGADCGTVEVESVVSQADGVNVVTVKTPLENFTSAGTTTLAFFTNRCASNSVITNCEFEGTFRFRGPITISDSTFRNMRTWINLEGTVEGPVPQNIIYKNCVIESTYANSQIIIGGITSGDTVVEDSGTNEFHVENIRFENCTLDADCLDISASDTDYVILSGCKSPDGTAIADMN